ncbi:hypothetical protein K0M31_018951 [Melipona bicolor]|uniref:Uncharacterized protein n=1 Tax=Melipona bicolor TaxID=60889 RepID=A0AA40FCX8_9HYME|nr:hypothetical protein K0M31_018951 [Melipona bicolor]
MTEAYSNGDRYDSSEKLAKKLARNGICPDIGADKIPCTVSPTLEIISVKQGTGGVRRFMRKIVIFTGTCHHINGVMRTVLRYLQLYKEPGDIYIHTQVPLESGTEKKERWIERPKGRRLRVAEEMSLLKRQKRASSTHHGHQRDKTK